MRQVPPARGSASQEITVQPRGPHQLFKRAGSVNASKTSSRGASNMRVMTSTRSAGSVTTTLLLAAMLLLPSSCGAFLLPSCGAFVLRLKRAQILVEPVKPLFPETTIFLEPVRRLFQRRGDELAGPPL